MQGIFVGMQAYGRLMPASTVTVLVMVRRDLPICESLLCSAAAIG